jgi:hypothetical protein
MSNPEVQRRAQLRPQVALLPQLLLQLYMLPPRMRSTGQVMIILHITMQII